MSPTGREPLKTGGQCGRKGRAAAACPGRGSRAACPANLAGSEDAQREPSCFTGREGPPEPPGVGDRERESEGAGASPVLPQVPVCSEDPTQQTLQESLASEVGTQGSPAALTHCPCSLPSGVCSRTAPPPPPLLSDPGVLGTVGAFCFLLQPNKPRLLPHFHERGSKAGGVK